MSIRRTETRDDAFARVSTILRGLPNELVELILKKTGEAGGAHHMCKFVSQECNANAPWLDCNQDSTWRLLSIQIFGGENAIVSFIDRWKAEHMPLSSWKHIFELLCSCYSSVYLALKNGTRANSGCDVWMMGVFMRFREFPHSKVVMAPDKPHGLRPRLTFNAAYRIDKYRDSTPPNWLNDYDKFWSLRRDREV